MAHSNSLADAECLTCFSVFDGGDLGGQLSNDPVESRRVAGGLLEPFFNPEASLEGRMRIVEAHDDVARRIFSV